MAGKVDHGRFIVTTTVDASDAVIESTDASAWPVRPAFLTPSRFLTTAAASSGSPSWKLMPGRSTIVHSGKPALDVISLARYGCGLPSGPFAASGSKMAFAIR